MSAMETSNEDRTNALNVALERTPPAEAEAIVREQFGIDGKAFILSSERDETFLIHTEEQGDYVLKIANPAESFEVLSFQTSAMTHLAGKRLAIPLPRPITAKTGDVMLSLPVGNVRRLTRLLTFLDGQQLYKAPRSIAQMGALGTALAQIGMALADFDPVVPEQTLLWDICNAAKLRPFVPHVEPSRQAILESVLDSFEELMEDGMGDLPQQIIHNDFNPHNILVMPSDPAVVAGVIDFGDMVRAPLVNDLAVALSYQIGADSGIENAFAMLSAFHRVRPLGSLEIMALPTLLRTRLAMTVIITEWRAALYPENRDYILRNHPVALAGLTCLADISDGDLGKLFGQQIGDFA